MRAIPLVLLLSASVSMHLLIPRDIAVPVTKKPAEYSRAALRSASFKSIIDQLQSMKLPPKPAVSFPKVDETDFLTYWQQRHPISTTPPLTVDSKQHDFKIDWDHIPMDTVYMIPEYLKPNKTLGRGTFSKVIKAYDLELKKDVAAKLIMKKGLIKLVSNFKEALNHEIFINSKMPEHPALIKYYRFADTKSLVMLETELFEGDNLEQMMGVKWQSESEARSIMKQVLGGLQAMHENGIYHLDVKPGNILLNKRTGKIKLIDYGLAVTDKGPFNVSLESPYGKGSQEVALTNQFTPALMDIWQFGSTLYQIVSRITPFRGYASVPENERIEKKRYKIVPKLTEKVKTLIERRPDANSYIKYVYPLNSYIIPRLDHLNLCFPINRFWSHELQDLLKNIFTTPDKRLSLEEISAHPWFTKTE